MATLGPISISTTADDGYQEGSSWLVDGYSNLLYLGGYAGTPYDLGLRFNGITIPAGSTVTSVVIELYHRFTLGQISSGVWYAWAHDNAPQFSSTNLPRSVTKTSASASWTPSGQGTAGWKSSPNLASLVQEIINRPGWSSGNSIAFACLSTTYTVGNDCDFEDYAHTSSNHARITIEYTTGGGTPGTATPAGVSSTSSVGPATAKGKGKAAPAGIAAASTAGSVTGTGRAKVAVTGTGASSAVGTATSTGKATATSTGVSAAASVGTATASHVGGSVAYPAGVSASAQVGTTTATGKAAVAPQGVTTTAALGTATGKGRAVANVTGLSAATGVGAVSGRGRAVALPGGLVAATATGAAVSTGKARFTVTGISATAHIGTAVAGHRGAIPLEFVATVSDPSPRATVTIPVLFRAAVADPSPRCRVEV